MTPRRNILGFAAALTLMGAPAPFAATPTGLDVPPTGIGGAAIQIPEGGNPSPAAARERQPRGNPLWAVPISMLSATRERPIFLPSRRPPAPVLAARRAEPVMPVAAPPSEPERPQLALVGAVTGENEAIAVFIEKTTNDVVRLRMGQNHAGWVLSAVKGRAATLQKDQETLVLDLPAPGSAPAFALPAAGPPPGPVVGGGTPTVPAFPGHTNIPRPNSRASSNGPLVVPDPAAGAPYVPRSAPKNGESDGL